MTTELEKQFFSTFGIDPTVYTTYCKKATPVKDVESVEIYPQITDRILLELICIYSDFSFLVGCKDIEHLKEVVLTGFINRPSGRYKQVQELFKGE